MRTGVLIVLMSSFAYGQEAPMAVYPGPAKSLPKREAGRTPPGYHLAVQPARYRFAPLSEIEKKPGGDRLLPRIGVGRNLPVDALDPAMAVKLPDGRRLWRAGIVSEGAVALRVHFRGFSGDGGEFWVYTPPQDGRGVQSEGPFTGPGPFGDGEFWTGALPGDEVIVEYLEASPDAAGALPPFAIDRIAHLWSSAVPEPSIPGRQPQAPNSALSATTEKDLAASCELDATCYPQYREMANAVVLYDFQGDDGNFYGCSGAMINTRNSSFVPYLLTANHCINSDNEARSIEAFFFYQTSLCNGPPPLLSDVPRVLGGHYVEGRSFDEGDFALVLLKEDVPPGATFLGWGAGDLNPGDYAIGIHHPKGSWKRISFGSRIGDADARIGDVLAPKDSYYQVGWSEGRVERGSSGSPILNNQGQIFGTLSYSNVPPPGKSICDINPVMAGYGRFGKAYAVLSPYLEGTPPPTLSVSPASLRFTIRNGVFSGPSQQTITVATPSEAAVVYTVTASTPWIKLSGSGGAVSASSSASIRVSADPSYFADSTTATGTVLVSASAATPIQVTVEADVTVAPSNVSVTVNPNPVYQQAADSEGNSWFYTIRLAETAGVATKLTSFRIGDSDHSGDIVSWFGSDHLPGGGALSAAVRLREPATPANQIFQAGGVDSGSGRAWTTEIPVPFLARPAKAVLAMDSLPALIRQNPNSADCPWRQELVLQETGGFDVTMTRFSAGGRDLSPQIMNYWKTNALPADGSLAMGICWTGIQPPEALAVEIGGKDSGGSDVSVSVNGNFSGPAVEPIAMSAVPASMELRALPGSSTGVMGTISLDPGSASAGWTARIVFPKPPNNWLLAYPLSGAGVAALKIIAQPGGLGPGSYDATLLVQSLDAVPQLLDVPIRFIIGAAGAGPSITSVANAAHDQPGFAAQTWVAIKGVNLSATVRSWQGPDFAGGKLPLQLDGVSVSINGKPAPVYYVSPAQVNVLAPDDPAPGMAAVEVVTPQGRSTAAAAERRAVAPGWFLFEPEGRKYIAAVHSDGAYLGKPGLYAAQNFRPAKPGDVAVLYGTGFGPVSPAAPADELVAQPAPLDNLVTVWIGGVASEVQWAGLVSSGLYQFNVVVPEVADGDQAVVAETGGEKTQTNAYITIQR